MKPGWCVQDEMIIVHGGHLFYLANNVGHAAVLNITILSKKVNRSQCGNYNLIYVKRLNVGKSTVEESKRGFISREKN